MDWQDLARCKGDDPDRYHPEKGQSARYARSVCAECVVESQCLDYAIEHNEPHGVWGGKTTKERRKIRQERRRVGTQLRFEIAVEVRRRVRRQHPSMRPKPKPMNQTTFDLDV